MKRLLIVLVLLPILSPTVLAFDSNVSVDESDLLRSLVAFCSSLNLRPPQQIDSVDIVSHRDLRFYDVDCGDGRDFEIDAETMEVVGYFDFNSMIYDESAEMKLSTYELKSLSRDTGLIPEDAVYLDSSMSPLGYYVYWGHYVQGVEVVFDLVSVAIDPGTFRLNAYSKTWHDVSKKAISEYEKIGPAKAVETATDFLSRNYRYLEPNPAIMVQRMVFAPRVYYIGGPDRNETSSDRPLCYEVVYCPAENHGYWGIVVWVDVQEPKVVGTNAIMGDPDVGACLSNSLDSTAALLADLQEEAGNLWKTVAEQEDAIDILEEQISALRNQTAMQRDRITALVNENREIKNTRQIVLVGLVVAATGLGIATMLLVKK